MARENSKGSRKDSPKGRTSRARKKVESTVESNAAAVAALDPEIRRTQLKALITLGKERGYLTYAEISDHPPDDVADAEQIEGIIATFNNMGIQVYDAAPAAEDLLMSDSVATNVDEDVAEEEAEQALSSVDSEFGRTTDPVRMYMREMGTVELLTREGEIEIAKRIEDGLKHMVQAISACPTTIAEMLDIVDRVARDEAKIDELVDGVIDPNASSEAGAAEDDDAAVAADADEGQTEEADEETEDADDEDSADSAERANAASLLQLKNDALARFDVIRGLYAKKMATLDKKGSQDLTYLALQQQISDELLNIRFTAKAIEKLCDSVRHMVEQVRSHERQILQLCVDRAGMPRQHFIKVFPGHEVNLDWLKNEITAGKIGRASCREREESTGVQGY